jgi:hypothetical protein
LQNCILVIFLTLKAMQVGAVSTLILGELILVNVLD